MNKLIFPVFLLTSLSFLSHQSESSLGIEQGDHYFFCNILPENFRSGDPIPVSDDKLDYFDFLFYYKNKGDKLEARLPYAGKPASNLKLNNSILSQAYFTGTKNPNNESSFHVSRINLKTNILTHSYVYYVTQKSLKTDFQKTLPYNKPSLFPLIDQKAPEGYAKIGWDKTKWKCEKISYWSYVKFSVQSLLFIFSA